MKADPIVEEVRTIRDDFARRHNYDIDAIVQALRDAAARRGHAMVSLPPRTVDVDEKPEKAA